MVSTPRQGHRLYPLLVASLSGFLSGLFLGEWNILIEVIRGKSIFGLEDIVKISLWHVIIWS